MGDDAEAVDAPTEYPEGVPALKSFLAIRPRSRRAEFKRKLSEFFAQQDKVQKIQDDMLELQKQSGKVDQAAQMSVWADADDMYQLVDDLLRIAAVDPEEYAAWSDEVDDNDLMTTFNVYQQRTQPGEASSSTS
jgi:hypothetical protein